MKSCLKKCIGGAKLSYDELHTCITEIEAVLNSRPLAYLYDEIQEPLTPSHLIVGRRLLNLPALSSLDLEDRVFDEEGDGLPKREAYLSKVLDNYWKRWTKEYLVDLREYHKLQYKGDGTPDIQEDDIVTIEDENRKNRLSWKIGRVKSVRKGLDNIIRGAKIKLAIGRIIERPVQKVYPLELSPRNVLSTNNNKPLESTEQHVVIRPRRKAASLAR